MSHTKTIGTIIASLVIGAIAFLVSTPKKVNKRKDVRITEAKETDATQDLFI